MDHTADVSVRRAGQAGRRHRQHNYDYVTVLTDGEDSQPLPTWKTYCEYSLHSV